MPLFSLQRLSKLVLIALAVQPTLLSTSFATTTPTATQPSSSPATIGSALVQANWLAENRKFTEAEQSLRKQLQAQPENTEIRDSLVSVELHQKDWLSAIAEASERYYRNPFAPVNNLPPSAQQIRYLYGFSETLYLEPLLRLQIQRNPRSLPLRLQLITVLRGYENTAGMVKEARELTQLYPQDAQVFQVLAATLVEQGQVSQALTALNTAIRLNPRLESARYGFARIQEQSGKSQDAIARYQRILQQNPRSFLAQRQLGEVYIGMQQLPEAIAAFQKALALQPDNDALICRMHHYQRGLTSVNDSIARERNYLQQVPNSLCFDHAALVWTLISARRVNDVYSLYDSFTSRYPTIAARGYETLYAGLTDFQQIQSLPARERQERERQALEAIRKAQPLVNYRESLFNILVSVLSGEGKTDESIKLHWNFMRTYTPIFSVGAAGVPFNLIQLLESQKRSIEAQRVPEELVKHAPRYAAQLFHYQSTIALGENRIPQAIALTRRAFQLSPDEPNIVLSLANGLEGQGQTQAAIAELQWAAQTNPKIAPALQSLQIRFLLRQNQVKPALDLLVKQPQTDRDRLIAQGIGIANEAQKLVNGPAPKEFLTQLRAYFKQTLPVADQAAAIAVINQVMK